MDVRLSGKTAVVTGAGAGIGRGIAKALAQEGVQLLVTARHDDNLKTLAQEIIALGGPEPARLTQDSTAPGAPGRIADEAVHRLGSVDTLINNAGASLGVNWDASDEQWHDGMALNFDSHRRLTQALLPHMMARKFGRIINIIGSIELKQINIAAAAKAALVVWSKALAHQMGEHNITVNCIEPGLIHSNQFSRVSPAVQQTRAAPTAFKSFGEPEDVAAAAVFLASEAAHYITGTTLIVDGGLRQRSF